MTMNITLMMISMMNCVVVWFTNEIGVITISNSNTLLLGFEQVNNLVVIKLHGYLQY